MTILLYKLYRYEALLPNLVRMVLIPEQQPLLYLAGQYLEILYPDDTYQPFSIANAPQANGKLELHIRHLSDDQSTAAMLKQVQEKTSVLIRGPFGKAIYRETPENPVILLAGGTGFAYIKAIAEAAIEKHDPRFFHLYWGVKTETDFYLAQLPANWEKQLHNFSYTPIISQARNSSWHGKKGYLYPVVLADYPDLSNYQIYASGPQAMVLKAYEIFIQHGLQKERMYSDMLTA